MLPLTVLQLAAFNKQPGHSMIKYSCRGVSMISYNWPLSAVVSEINIKTRCYNSSDMTYMVVGYFFWNKTSVKINNVKINIIKQY